MATVEDVATRVLASAAIDPDNPVPITLVGRWVSDRYHQLVAQTRFRHRRSVGLLSVPAAVVDGLMTATRGSATVVADGDAQTAITAAGGGAAIVGRHLRIASVWYEITAYVSPNLTIAAPYGETSATSHGYLIVARYVSLASDARWLGTFVHTRYRQPLRMASLDALDRGDPARTLVSGGPWYWAEAGRDADGAVRVELYPYSREVEAIGYTYWTKPPDLALEDDIPNAIDPYVLREGALIDLYRYEAGREAAAKRMEMAAYWRNESRAQETVWQRYMQEGARTDRPANDASFILYTLGLSLNSQRDITDGPSEIFARGNRP